LSLVASERDQHPRLHYVTLNPERQRSTTPASSTTIDARMFGFVGGASREQASKQAEMSREERESRSIVSYTQKIDGRLREN